MVRGKCRFALASFSVKKTQNHFENLAESSEMCKFAPELNLRYVYNQGYANPQKRVKRAVR